MTATVNDRCGRLGPDPGRGHRNVAGGQSDNGGVGYPRALASSPASAIQEAVGRAGVRAGSGWVRKFGQRFYGVRTGAGRLCALCLEVLAEEGAVGLVLVEMMRSQDR